MTEATSSKFTLWCNMRKFAVSKPRMTGGEIKALANASPAYPLFYDTDPTDANSAQVAVGDGEAVEVADRHFYTCPPATRR